MGADAGLASWWRLVGARRQGALERDLVLCGRLRDGYHGGMLVKPGDEVCWNGSSCYVG